VLPDDVTFDPVAFREFLLGQADLGVKQWPSFVRVSSSLPRTETFKIIKRHLSAEALDCDDPVFEIPR
jgi:fatty-acyl-CoA synthase